MVSSYARLDLLRPYFDVEPRDIGGRLLRSLWPQFSRQTQVLENYHLLQTLSELHLSFRPWTPTSTVR